MGKTKLLLKGNGRVDLNSRGIKMYILDVMLYTKHHEFIRRAWMSLEWTWDYCSKGYTVIIKGEGYGEPHIQYEAD